MNKTLSHVASESVFTDKENINRGESVSGKGTNQASIWSYVKV